MMRRRIVTVVTYLRIEFRARDLRGIAHMRVARTVAVLTLDTGKHLQLGWQVIPVHTAGGPPAGAVTPCSALASSAVPDVG